MDVSGHAPEIGLILDQALRVENKLQNLTPRPLTPRTPSAPNRRPAEARSNENGQPFSARYDRQPPAIGIFVVPRIVAPG